MSIGALLDAAAKALQLAATEMATAEPDRYHVVAAAHARERFYRELTLLLTTLGVTPARNRSTTDVQDISPSAVLASIIHVAPVGLPNVSADLLRAWDGPASRILQACDAVGLASETLATHVPPTPLTIRQLATRRYLTHEGAAIFRGAQAGSALGEIARLTLEAIRVDEVLLRWSRAHSDVIAAHHRFRLERWAAGAWRELLTGVAATEPATLLRGLGPAPPTDRPTGPRAIASWADAFQAIAAARSAVIRDTQVGTIGLTRSAARLGFAVAAASWKLTGDSEPSLSIAALGSQWRRLACALDAIADRRAGNRTALIEELDNVKTWLRTHINSGLKPDGQALSAMHDQLRLLCGELRRPLMRARAHDELMVSTTMVLGSENRRAVVVAVPKWTVVTSSDPRFMAMIEALGAAAALPDLPDAQESVQLPAVEARPEGVVRAFPTVVAEASRQVGMRSAMRFQGSRARSREIDK